MVAGSWEEQVHRKCCCLQLYFEDTWHALALEIIKNYKSRILRVETKFLSFFEHINISDHG